MSGWEWLGGHDEVEIGCDETTFSNWLLTHESYTQALIKTQPGDFLKEQFCFSAKIDA